MRISSGIVRGVVVAAAVLTLGTAGASGEGYGIGADASLVGASAAAQVMDQVVGGQHAGLVALVAALPLWCVQCVFGAASAGQVDLVELVQCAIICDIAF